MIPAAEITLIPPFQRAWDHMKWILFSPFDLKKWLLLGLSCFLAEVASYSSNFSGNYSGGDTGSTGGGGNIWEGLQSMFGEWAALAMGLGIVLIIAFVCLILVIGLALIWVSCHGTFVFIDNVVQNRTEIVASWKKYSPQAWQLFWFYLVTGLALFLAIFVWVFVAVFLMKSGVSGWDMENPVGLAVVILPVVAVMILWMLGWFGVEAMVIPRMYGQQCGVIRGCLDAWNLFCEHPFSWLKFLAFMVLVWIGIIVAILLTCLLTCCLAILPYIHHVICLPIYVFIQAYYLTFLAQFGNGWNVFPETPPEIQGKPSPSPSPSPLPGI